MFGQQQSTPFGSPAGGGFGQQNAAPGGFGTPAPSGFGAAPASGGFGTFGSSAPAPAFGSGGGFGAPAPASGFGGGGSTFGSAPAPTAFGAPAPGGFGAPASTPFGAPASGGSLFGSPAPAPGGFGGSSLFGAPSPAPAVGSFGGGFGSSPAPAPGGFGAPTTSAFGSSTGAFGSTANTTPAFGSSTSTFGAPAPSTGLFGAPAPAPSTGFGSTGGFGSSTTTGAFGGAAPATGGFGAPAGGMGAAPGSGGTKVTPFQPTQRQDGASHITLHSITAMPQYEQKSFEELRFEDYSQGNKGTGGTTQPGATTGGFSGFGSPSPAPGGLFGSSSAPAPGAFGAPAPAAGVFGNFGSSPSPAAFGSTTPTPFGAAPSPGGFGSTTGAFGAQPPAPGGLFGAPAPAPTSGLFGSNPAPASGGLFGQNPAPASFGAPAPAAGGGLFGSAAPAPAPFGSAPAPGAFGTGFGAPSPSPSAFGAPSSAPGGFGFASPAPAPGGFSAFGSTPAPAPAFGAPAPSAFGGFAASTSAFGAKPPGSGLFGQPAPAPGGSIFGASPAPAPAFGAQPQAPPMAGTLPPVGSIMPPAANDIMASQLAALESKRKELEEKDSFRSQPSPSAAVSAASLGERDSGGFGSFTPARLSFPTRRASPLSSAKIRPRGFASPPSDVTGGLSLSRLGNAGRPMPTPESAAAAASTRLIVAPTPKPKLKLILGNETPAKNSTTDPSLLDINGTNGNSREGGLGSVKPTRVTSPFATPEPVSTPTPAGGSHTTNGSKSPSSTTRADLYYQQAIGSPDALAVVTVSTSALPKLSKEGYICSPSIETMESLDPGDLAALPNFSVSRPGVGKVEWEGAVDVRGANLDKVVVIEPKSVSVYTEEEELGTKPRVGTKLNRPAVLTLEGVFPPDGAGSDGVEKFTRKVAKTTKKMDAELISYDPVGGEWKLKVKHFSRYALDDSDDDSDDGGAAGGEAIEVSPPEAMLQRKVDFQGTSPRASRGLAKVRKDTPYKSARSEGEEYFDMVSDEDMEDEDVFLEADQAYKRMQQNLARENELLQAKKKFELETTPFPEETEALFDHSEMLTDIFVPSLQDLEMAFSMPSITTKLLSATKSRTTNSRIDYGLRMGKSFRVAWGPDGSFLSIKKDGVITRSKPKFLDETSGSQLVMLHAHNSICQKISTNDDCPLLAIVPTRAAPMNKVLETYTNKIADSTSIEYNSFSLLSVINEAQVAKSSSRGGTDPDLDARCMFAFNQFLIASCSHDVLVELASQGSSLDFKSLLAAISSGNLQMAANVADQIGLPQLSILLTCPAARGCVLKEMRSWKNMPEDLKRCYRIIAGDLSMESRSCAFDWKRLMSMNLAYTERPRDLSSLVRQYEERVASGDAPFPSPNYLKAPSSGNETVESVMFKLMKLEGASDVKENLTIYIDPLGYTANPHDVSLAFHLAASISAMAGRPRLSPEEEESLIDGLKAQLLSSGLWQWCVYVSLCSLNPQSISPSFIDWRLNQAKSLISRHYQQSEESKRDFLESIGVPKEWFEDALACRSKNDGDAFSYIQHTVAAGNLQEATEAFEKTYLPTGLFVEKAKLLQFLDIFDAFVSVESADSLVALLPDLVDVANAIELLEGSPQDEINAAGPKLLKLLDGVEGTLCKYESSEVFSKESLDMIPDIYPIPVGAFVVQAAEVTSFMRLQIMALQSGNSSKNTAGELTKLARSGRSKNSNIQRYLI